MVRAAAEMMRARPRLRAATLLFFVGPAFLIYGLFSVYPLASTMVLSTYGTNAAGQPLFVGLGNFVTLLTDDSWSGPFWNALQNNVVFFAIHMAVQNPVGIALAGMLSLPRVTGRHAYRTVIFLPTMLSVVIVGFIWQLILSPLWGVSEGILETIGLGHWFDPWLGQETTALITLSLISVWQFVGIPMILIYAALLNIPDDLTDAAQVDGIGHFRIFWHIKLPLIMPTVALVSILTYVGNFNAFDIVYAVKGAIAGPNFSTDILGTFFYRTFFGFQLQQGNPTMGAAVATVMFGVILIGVMIYLFTVQRRLQRHAF